VKNVFIESDKCKEDVRYIVQMFSWIFSVLTLIAADLATTLSGPIVGFVAGFAIDKAWKILFSTQPAC